MESGLPEDAEVVRDPLWGTVRRLEARELSDALDRDPEFRALRAAGDASRVAIFFLNANRTLLRLADPGHELAVHSVSTDELGFAHVKLGQTYEGLHVWGAEIVVHLDAELAVYLVNGHYVRSPEALETRPRLAADEARVRAAEAVGADVALDETRDPDLLLFPEESGALALAYLFRTRAGALQGWQVFVDAGDGHLIEKLSTVMSSGVGTLHKGEVPSETGRNP